MRVSAGKVGIETAEMSDLTCENSLVSVESTEENDEFRSQQVGFHQDGFSTDGDLSSNNFSGGLSDESIVMCLVQLG